MSLALAAAAAPELELELELELSTGIAVAFPRSPMMSAALAGELAGNTRGRFRLGLGAQVRAHVERRYSATFDHPGARLRDYVWPCAPASTRSRAARPWITTASSTACRCSPTPGAPSGTSGPTSRSMCWRWATGCAAWRERWPTASTSARCIRCTTCRTGLLPAVADGCTRAEREVADVDLIVPVFVAGIDADRGPGRAARLVRRRDLDDDLLALAAAAERHSQRAAHLSGADRGDREVGQTVAAGDRSQPRGRDLSRWFGSDAPSPTPSVA